MANLVSLLSSRCNTIMSLMVKVVRNHLLSSLLIMANPLITEDLPKRISPLLLALMRKTQFLEKP